MRTTADSTLTVPRGTRIIARLARAIDTRSAKIGDVVFLRVAFPVSQSGHMAMPVGTFINATLDSTALGRGTGANSGASLFVHLASITFANGYVRSPSTIARLATIPGSVEVRAPASLARLASVLAPSAGLGLGAALQGASRAVRGGVVGDVVGIATAIAVHYSTTDVFVAEGANVDVIVQADIVLDPRRVPSDAVAEIETEKCYQQGTPGTPDTTIPGTPGTPAVGTDPGTPGTPDTVIPGTPGTSGRWVECGSR